MYKKNFTCKRKKYKKNSQQYFVDKKIKRTFAPDYYPS
jgi:hypothetical protein